MLLLSNAPLIFYAPFFKGLKDQDCQNYICDAFQQNREQVVI